VGEFYKGKGIAKKDLKEDIEALDHLSTNLDKFKRKIDQETIQLNNNQSADNKLKTLIEQIEAKRKVGYNNNNRKVVIFTVYHDTARYLYDQLKARGYDKLAMVSGSGSLVWDSDEESK
ncbi:MAG: hypothetical protein ABEH43_07710, partial [Flavobacteriales bacterium]